MKTTLPVLGHRFSPPAAFERRTQPYKLLPLRFIRLDDARYAITNMVGEHLVVSTAQLHALIRRTGVLDDELRHALVARHFILEVDSSAALDLLSTKYRTLHSRLSDLTGLFIFVTTLRCEHSCTYCQVSRRTQDHHSYDMSPTTAQRAVDFMFDSPSPQLKVEFQGGESLLAFERIRDIVELVEDRNLVEQRDVAFVIATNLAVVTDEHLEYCKAHGISLSTSIDGPSDLHDLSRHRPGRDSHARAVAGLERARAVLGPDRVSALMTTTGSSLDRVEDIIDEYVRLRFDSIFLRPISPYGFAERSGQARRYDTEAWLDFYRRGLDHLLDLNDRGVFIREEYSAILLRKILTPFPTGYVDLQSPAGMGLGCLVFNYDGGIYASDEARMLAEMGDQSFRIGDLANDDFLTVLQSEALLDPVFASMTEAAPMCSDCGFQPYCGSDPIHHHTTQGDAVGFKPLSGFCERNMGVVRSLLLRMEDDPRALGIFRSWLR